MRQVTFTGPPPPTSDPMFLEWVRDRLNELQTASAENVFEPETLDAYAKKDSPVFIGNPRAPTPASNDNDTSIATTAYVQTELTDYAPLASPEFTGNPRAPTPLPGDNDTSIATTAFVAAGFVPASRAVNTGAGLSGGDDLAADITLALTNTGVTAATYNNMTATVDAQGRITSASSGATPGRVLLATLTTTSGTNATLTGISTTDYTALVCVVMGVSHDGSGGTPQSLRVEFTENNGSSWIGLQALRSIATAESVQGVLDVYNWKTTTNKLSSFNIGNGFSATIWSPTSTAALNGIRFNWSAGAAFDAGTIQIFGIR